MGPYVVRRGEGPLEIDWEDHECRKSMGGWVVFVCVLCVFYLRFWHLAWPLVE